MGQKINAISFRLGVACKAGQEKRSWDSIWHPYAHKGYGKLLHDDLAVRMAAKQAFKKDGILIHECFLRRSYDRCALLTYGISSGRGGSLRDQTPKAEAKLSALLQYMEGPLSQAQSASLWQQDKVRVVPFAKDNHQLQLHSRVGSADLGSLGPNRIEQTIWDVRAGFRKNPLASLRDTGSRSAVSSGPASSTQGTAILSANLIATYVATQLETPRNLRDSLFKFPLKKALRIVLDRFSKAEGPSARVARLRGIRIQCSGRWDGDERTQVVAVRQGQIPLQTLSVPLDYGFAVAGTAHGCCGIKVWLAKS